MGMKRLAFSLIIAFFLAITGIATVGAGDAQAALFFHSGFESGNTFEWATVTGTVAVQSTIKKTGTYAVKLGYYPFSAIGVVGNAGTTRQVTLAVYIDDIANLDFCLIGTSTTLRIVITLNRYIKLYDGATLKGTGSTQLLLDTWYRICLASSSTQAKVYLDGNVEIDTVSVSDNPPACTYGAGDAGAGSPTIFLYVDDIVEGNATDLTDLGDIRTLLSLPNAAGTYEDFDTRVSVAEPNEYQNVDDAPGAISDTDYNQQADTAAVKDTYNLQDASTIGIGASDTINAVRVLARMKRGTGSAGGGKAVQWRDNSTDGYQSITSTTAFVWYFCYYATMPADSGTWTQTRLNALQVGANHGKGATDAQDTFISAQMVMVAYTPYAAAADISNAPISKAFGTVAASTSYWSNGSAPTFPLDDAECFFTVTNNGGTCSITIKATNFTGGVGWTLGTPAQNVVRLKTGKSGDALETNMVTLTTSPQAFISALANLATKKWEVKMETPTSYTDGALKTSTITLTATLD